MSIFGRICIFYTESYRQPQLNLQLSPKSLGLTYDILGFWTRNFHVVKVTKIDFLHRWDPTYISGKPNRTQNKLYWLS